MRASSVVVSVCALVLLLGLSSCAGSGGEGGVNAGLMKQLRGVVTFPRGMKMDAAQWVSRAAEIQRIILKDRTDLQALVVPPTDDPQDIELFVLGFLAGFENTIGNLTACVQNGENIEKYFKKGAKKMLQGLEDLDEQLFQAGLEFWAMGMEAIANILPQCGALNLAKEIRRIVTILETEGILQLLILEFMNIAKNMPVIMDDASLAYYSFQIGDFWNAGIAIGEIFGLLLQL